MEYEDIPDDIDVLLEALNVALDTTNDLIARYPGDKKVKKLAHQLQELYNSVKGLDYDEEG